MNSEYFSRTNSFNEKELLSEHLYKVSNLCSFYMKDFDCPNLGKYLGFIHDVGKHTLKFQDVLDGKRIKINHSVGAFFKVSKDYKEFLFSNIFSEEYKKALLVYFKEICCISLSHHFGLSENWDFKNLVRAINLNNYSYFFTETDNKEISFSNRKEIDEALKYLESLGCDYYLFEKAFKEYIDIRSKCKNNLETMFLMRMIFSCLVDADYTASESFSNKTLNMYDDIKVDANLFFNKLSNYHTDLISKSNKSDINDLRNEIYSRCLESGKLDEKFLKLNAPTGTGKTLALMAYCTSFAKEHLNDTSRFIVVLPFLSIIDQNVKVYENIFGKDNVLEDDSNINLSDENIDGFRDSLIRENIERWNKPLVVTSSVKFFEMLFDRKGKNIRKLHYICNSIVTFDEAQSLSLDVLDSSILTLDFIKDVFNVKVLLSTATMPEYSYRNKLNDVKFFNIFDSPQYLFDKYNSIKKINSEWIIDRKIHNEELIPYVKKYQKTLIIFNKIKFAQNFYLKMKENFDDE